MPRSSNKVRKKKKKEKERKRRRKGCWTWFGCGHLIWCWTKRGYFSRKTAASFQTKYSPNKVVHNTPCIQTELKLKEEKRAIIKFLRIKKIHWPTFRNNISFKLNLMYDWETHPSCSMKLDKINRTSTKIGKIIHLWSPSSVGITWIHVCRLDGVCIWFGMKPV